MKEINVSADSTDIAGTVVVRVKPNCYLGGDFNKYRNAMAEADCKVREATSDQWGVKFNPPSKSYLAVSLLHGESFIEANLTSPVIDAIVAAVWESGLVPVADAGGSFDRKDSTESVSVDGIMALFDATFGKIKYPKIRLKTEAGKKLALSRAGNRSKYAGQIMLTDGGSFGENVYYGRIDEGGKVFPARAMSDDVMETIRNLSADAVKVAGAHGHDTGQCCFCTRHLSDERSVTVGYGPTCAGNFGLPWGVEE